MIHQLRQFVMWWFLCSSSCPSCEWRFHLIEWEKKKIHRLALCDLILSRWRSKSLDDWWWFIRSLCTRKQNRNQRPHVMTIECTLWHWIHTLLDQLAEREKKTQWQVSNDLIIKVNLFIVYLCFLFDHMISMIEGWKWNRNNKQCYRHVNTCN